MAKIDALLQPLGYSRPHFDFHMIELPGAQIPRVLIKGPRGGGDPLRIGLFAGIHGDEPAGVHALIHLAKHLAENSQRAEGYNLAIYPVCNPIGFEKGMRNSGTGKDLNREFWRNSAEPEVVFLEKEIRERSFQGLVSLHTDDTSTGIYGYVRGAVLTRALLEPALAAAESVIPRDMRHSIDGFPAHDGIISECFDGILTSPPELDPAPFEIILETPGTAPLAQQVEAFNVALQTVLAEYQKLLAFAANL